MASNSTNSTVEKKDMLVFWIDNLAYPIIALIGITGNGIVLFVFMRTKKMKVRLSNYFIINQSLIDFMASVSLLVSSYLEHHFTKTPKLYAWPEIPRMIFCKFFAHGIYLWVLFLASTYNLVALSLERYMSVLHPFKHKIIVTKVRVLVCLVGIWVLSAIYHASIQIPTATFVFGNCINMVNFPSPEVAKAVSLFNITLYFFIPIIAVCFSYGNIAMAFRKRVQPTTVQNSIEARNERIRKNTIQTFAIVSSLFFFCWVTNQIYFLLSQLGVSLRYDTPLYRMAVLLAFLNCCVNPFVYVASYKEFKTALKKIVLKSDSDSQMSVSTVEK